ncbi:MAG: hypothetical protein B7Y43_00130 [Sphingomonas sp. 28-62-20]|uniref:GIN domain-containing protein n=1 Tax=Sphingomonas sp. 28-62-20 TaxID=1970433 RepID=UPI000BCF8704|nr:MAG: hypothetical protein B7Y43_00130 [Sphingomonas sp. 28-62-20]
MSNAMIRLSPRAALGVVLLALTPPAAANAAERNYSVSSFDRIRVEGPFDVRLGTNQPPGGHAEADARTLDLLTLQVEGTTLIVRLSSNGWGESPQAARTAPVITLRTPSLRSALVNAGGKLAITPMKGQRLDLAVNGSGAISAAGIDADELYATVIGTGTIKLAGRTARAQLLSNGSGAIAAEALTVNDLIVRLDGTGETHAAARFTAKITTNGLGKVTVDGNPACTVTALAGGPIICGRP